MIRKADQMLEFSELADWVISQAKHKGAEECRVNVYRQRFVEIDYRDQKPEVIKEATTQGISLEIFSNKRYAGQSTPDFRKSTLDIFIDDVIANAAIVEEDPYRTLPEPEYYKGRTDEDLELFDPRYTELSPEKRHEMVKTVENACLEKGGDKVISVSAGEYDTYYESLVKTSNGFEGFNRESLFQTGATVTMHDEGDRRPAGSNWVSCRFREDMPSLEETGIKAAERTIDLIGGKKIATETLPVIIENRIAAGVLNGFMSAMSGANIQQKRSFLTDKKDSVVGSRHFTLINDPFIPRGLGSRYFDSDGFPARNREYISEGRLNDFIINWYYSRKLNCEPTSGSVSNIIIPAGNRDLQTIINDLGRCILITGFLGGNSNSTTGDFSLGINGKLFNNGQFVQNIAEMNIADNHLEFWHKLAATANDPWPYSSARLPSLVFENVVVAGI